MVLEALSSLNDSVKKIFKWEQQHFDQMKQEMVHAEALGSFWTGQDGKWAPTPWQLHHLLPSLGPACLSWSPTARIYLFIYLFVFKGYDQVDPSKLLLVVPG